jgi:hypothetical protein
MSSHHSPPDPAVESAPNFLPKSCRSFQPSARSALKSLGKCCRNVALVNPGFTRNSCQLTAERIWRRMSRRWTICRPFPPHSAPTTAPSLRTRERGSINARRYCQIGQNDQPSAQASQVCRRANRAASSLPANRDFRCCRRRALSKRGQKSRLSACDRRTGRARRRGGLICEFPAEKSSP